MELFNLTTKALSEKRFDTTKFLIKALDLKYYDQLLLLAVKKCAHEILSHLLQFDLKIDEAFCAAINKDDLTAVKLFLEHGLNKEILHKGILCSIEARHFEILKVILSNENDLISFALKEIDLEDTTEEFQALLLGKNIKMVAFDGKVTYSNLKRLKDDLVGCEDFFEFNIYSDIYKTLVWDYRYYSVNEILTGSIKKTFQTAEVIIYHVKEEQWQKKNETIIYRYAFSKNRRKLLNFQIV